MIIKKSDLILREYTKDRWECSIKNDRARTNCGGPSAESAVLGVLNHNTEYFGVIYTDCFGYTDKDKQTYNTVLRFKTGYQRQLTYYCWGPQHIFKSIKDNLYNQSAVYTNYFN